MSINSRICIWHGFGAMTSYSSHDGDTGNAAHTHIRIEFDDSYPAVDVEYDDQPCVRSLTISIDGSSERQGLARLFQELSIELSKKEGQSGEELVIGYDDEDALSPNQAQQKGLVGESKLNQWLNAIGISYLYINQSPDTFANLFNASLKRPDFLLLLESVGLIAVDAKNRELHYNDKTRQPEYSLPFELELKRVMTFERLFRIPVWYAYLSEEPGELGSTWYWISALKALEVGVIKKNGYTQEDFLVIERRHFERVERNEDLGKLYTHRLSSLRKLKNI
jgi:hypothetical protein